MVVGRHLSKTDFPEVKVEVEVEVEVEVYWR